MRKFILSVFLAFATLIMAQQNLTLPIDPQVRTGKLENGLTYYIRHNNLPEHRADSICQKVGSMQEEDIKQDLPIFGTMAFNGQKFSRQNHARISAEQRYQVRLQYQCLYFFDETVYYLTDIPTNNKN
jgi:zinc protease